MCRNAKVGLSGCDRLVFRGSLRKTAYPLGMYGRLWANQVPLKGFGTHVKRDQWAGERSGSAMCAEIATLKYLQSSETGNRNLFYQR